MTFPISGYIGVGALIAGILGGWTVRDWKADSDALKAESKAQAQYRALTETIADQSLAYEVLAQSLRTGERADRETIREVYRDKVVPAECVVHPDAVRVLSEAITRANSAAGQSGG